MSVCKQHTSSSFFPSNTQTCSLRNSHSHPHGTIREQLTPQHKQRRQKGTEWEVLRDSSKKELGPCSLGFCFKSWDEIMESKPGSADGGLTTCSENSTGWAPPTTFWILGFQGLVTRLLACHLPLLEHTFIGKCLHGCEKFYYYLTSSMYVNAIEPLGCLFFQFSSPQIN